MNRRPLIVGWAPSKRGEGCFNGTTGKFLSKLIGVKDFHEHFDAVNLLTYPVDMYITIDVDWRINAETGAQLIRRHRVIVLCGRDVQRAFGVEGTPEWCSKVRVKGRRGDDIYVIPHPSGRCRAWNDEALRRKVGMLLRSLI